ncbi:hypothetical protein [Microbacterium sp. NPDC055683]
MSTLTTTVLADDDFDEPFSRPFIPRATPGLAGHRTDDLATYCRDAAAGHVVGVTSGTERTDQRAREGSRRPLRTAVERDDVDELTLARARRALALAVLEAESLAEEVYARQPWVSVSSTEPEAFALWVAVQLPALVVRAGANDVADVEAFLRAALRRRAIDYVRAEAKRTSIAALEDWDEAPAVPVPERPVHSAVDAAVERLRALPGIPFGRRERLVDLLRGLAGGRTAADVVAAAERSVATAHRDLATVRSVMIEAGLLPTGPTARLPRAKAAA